MAKILNDEGTMSSSHEGEEFIPVKIALLTVSDTRNEDSDTSGRLLAERLAAAGHHLVEKVILPDNIYRIRALVSKWIADPAVEVVISTGGTGMTDRDLTPEAITPLLDKSIDGFGELFRSVSYGEIGSSTIQSRVFAGIANGTFIFAVPGSTNACSVAWDHILGPQLDNRTKPCNFVQLFPRLRRD
jgi:molybdenum cofactor biosynthesis protein B